jgi:predicted flap endonuclease-1-like 5' DNA nuclease
LSAISTVILGLLFVALGYSQRPRLKTSLMIRPTPQPPATTAPQVTLSPVPTVQETVTPQPTEAVAPIKTKLELTQVKGIKEKRAEQLRALGIKSVEDLANASAAELAAKLKIASYFTEKWIENAKELAGKS